MKTLAAPFIYIIMKIMEKLANRCREKPVETGNGIEGNFHGYLCNET